MRLLGGILNIQKKPTPNPLREVTKGVVFLAPSSDPKGDLDQLIIGGLNIIAVCP